MVIQENAFERIDECDLPERRGLSNLRRGVSIAAGFFEANRDKQCNSTRRGRSLSPLRRRSKSLLSMLLPRKCSTGKVAPELSIYQDLEVATVAPISFASSDDEHFLERAPEAIIPNGESSDTDEDEEDLRQLLKREREMRMLLEDKVDKLTDELENERELTEILQEDLEAVEMALKENQKIMELASFEWVKDKRTREMLEDKCSNLKESLYSAEGEVSSLAARCEELASIVESLKEEKDNIKLDCQNQIMQLMISGKCREHGYYMKMSEAKDAFSEKLRFLGKLVEEFEVRMGMRIPEGENEGDCARPFESASDESLVAASRGFIDSNSNFNFCDLLINGPSIDSDAYSLYSGDPLRDEDEFQEVENHTLENEKVNGSGMEMDETECANCSESLKKKNANLYLERVDLGSCADPLEAERGNPLLISDGVTNRAIGGECLENEYMENQLSHIDEDMWCSDSISPKEASPEEPKGIENFDFTRSDGNDSTGEDANILEDEERERRRKEDEEWLQPLRTFILEKRKNGESKCRSYHGDYGKEHPSGALIIPSSLFSFWSMW